MSKLSELFKHSREKVQEKIKKIFPQPPAKVKKYIEDHVKETFEINNGNLDKDSFRLGMYSMWFYIKKNPNSLNNE